jgi:dienelactone hydrolase
MTLLLLFATLFSTPQGHAKIQTKVVDYKSADGATLEGYLAYDDAAKKPQPGILIVHDWMGLGDFFKKKAEDTAKMGYVVFAADIYGKGLRPKDAKEAAAFATKYKSDVPLLRKRAEAALAQLTNNKLVQPGKIVTAGYCFGGTTVLELARAGAPVTATVTFHGGLSTPHPEDAKNIKGPLLVLHGADDPYVPATEVAAFKKEMADAKVPMTFIAYPGAVHAFTIPAAGTDNSKGAAYNASADKKSWEEFKKFLSKTL